MDLTSAYAASLLALLVTAGQQVVYVPGTMVNRMSGAFAGEGKTDARDAKVIAETARLRRDLTQITTPNELVVELSLLVGHRADLMADWVRGVNRLRDLLTRVFPALERAFDYSTRAPLILLTGYSPGPCAGRRQRARSGPGVAGRGLRFRPGCSITMVGNATVRCARTAYTNVVHSRPALMGPGSAAACGYADRAGEFVDDRQSVLRPGVDADVSTHPDTAQRIARLRDMARSQER